MDTDACMDDLIFSFNQKKKNEVMSREILQTVVKNVALLCICIMHKGKIDVCDKYYVCIVNNKYTFLFFFSAI